MIIITEYPYILDIETYHEFSDLSIQDMRGFDKYVEYINNNFNLSFNQKIYKYFNNTNIRILDLGCAHGEMVVSFIKDGCVSIGLEACPRYKNESYNWIHYPGMFFQCDLGEPFKIIDNDSIVIFDLITSWECFEHIKTEDVDQVFQNI